MTHIPMLTKSRFIAGLQCQKLLWLRVHERDAPELRAEAASATLRNGNRVGEVARTYFPGGVLIDIPHHEPLLRVDATRDAIESGATVIFEASFFADDIFVAVDILTREDDGSFVLIEVKSATSVKEVYLPDVAVQLHVLRSAGLRVARAEVMHINNECRLPDLSNLFTRVDVTELVTPLLTDVPQDATQCRATIAQPEVPEVAIGRQCHEPYECPFKSRCWVSVPEHHMSTLYRFSSEKTWQLINDHLATIFNIPDPAAYSHVQQMQILSVQQDKLLVKPGLAIALTAFTPPFAFLDFETIQPPIPRWLYCAPYAQIPVQFSCHVERDGTLAHYEWLAESQDDPREALALALLEATGDAATVFAYNASFEKGRIAELANLLPHLKAPLEAINDRVRDLLPVVRNNVYHPAFGGSFSLKSVLPALVEGPGYRDLTIASGDVAAAELDRYLFEPTSFAPGERETLRHDLLEYCKQDTYGLWQLFHILHQLPPNTA